MSPNESDLEIACCEWLSELGWSIKDGPEILPGGNKPSLRSDHRDVVLSPQLQDAVARINPQYPADLVEGFASSLLRQRHPTAIAENLRLHEAIVNGVPEEYRDEATGNIKHEHLWLIDWENPRSNTFSAVTQFTIIEDHHNRRPDVVLFVNGLPLAVIELKDPGDRNATLKGAYNQLQTYRAEIPSLFRTNVLNVISDGIGAKMGSTTAGWEHFAPWKTIDGNEVAPRGMPQLEVLLKGVFKPEYFLDIVRNFVAFQDEGTGLVKKVAKYHQFWAVRKAVESTVEASTVGDGRAGVVWHTQGSGKSLEMLFYAAKVMRHPGMQNPTLVLLTDRNDLDDQLFDEVFVAAKTLPETPVQAEDREHLQDLLRKASGGIVFTTIQKFFPKLAKGESAKGAKYPLLSDRRNVVVIADEAHRSQYQLLGSGFAKFMRDGLPNATYIGFTGTPIETGDRSTKDVFGEYISVYDLTQAVEDGATVKIYYEARLAQIELDEAERPRLDDDVEDVLEDEEEPTKERAKTKWARLEALVGADKRVKLVAKDIVEHWEERRDVLQGKAMIVCMSRRICAALYEEIIKLRPEWHSDDDEVGKIKVVITGSAADDAALQPHIRNVTIQTPTTL